MNPNYYTLLGVTPRASASEIKRAYRRLARQHHPDVNAQVEDEQIKRVNEAYAVLSDSRQRQRYDEELRQARQRIKAERREQEKAQRGPKMTWVQGASGFVREFKEGMRDESASSEQPNPQQEAAQGASKMTWMQGAFGFVRELKKDMRED